MMECSECGAPIEHGIPICWDCDDQDIDGLQCEIAALRAERDAALNACRSALKCIALLTPFPPDDENPLAKAINRTADYADSVRDELRTAIALAKRTGRE